jgi:LysM repeat protein
MSRRDTVIIAVLINAGLLAVLFIMAVNPDDEKISEHSLIEQSLVYERPLQMEVEGIQSVPSRPTDEFDHVLSELTAHETPQPVLAEELPNRTAVGAVDASPQRVEEETRVAITVKRGDSLEKIAKANGITVSAITKANNLKTEKLKIGQVLQIPVVQNNRPTISLPVVAEASETEYYVIKSGDNPWKIAKQFHVKFDDLLKLNNLDEEKARNLKIGDKIRIH